MGNTADCCNKDKDITKEVNIPPDNFPITSREPTNLMMEDDGLSTNKYPRVNKKILIYS